MSMNGKSAAPKWGIFNVAVSPLSGISFTMLAFRGGA